MTEVRRRQLRFEPMPMRVPLDQIGGARVVRQFRMNGEIVKVGTMLTPPQIMAMNPVNRAHLIDRFLQVWPKPMVKSPPSSDADSGAGPTERATSDGGLLARHVVPLGFGRYDVVQGTKLNEKAVDRQTAFALAGTPLPPEQKAPRRKRA